MTPIGNNIKLLRWHLHETQQAFAVRFSTTRGAVNAYEMNKVKSLPADFVGLVCTYFGITQDQLLKQKLTEDDLKPTGSIESVTEVRLQEALKRIELLENTVADKVKIIELLGGNVTKTSPSDK